MPKPTSHHKYVAGKGSWRRPCLVPREEFEKRWDEIFGSRDQGSHSERRRREIQEGDAAFEEFWADEDNRPGMAAWGEGEDPTRLEAYRVWMRHAFLAGRRSTI